MSMNTHDTHPAPIWQELHAGEWLVIGMTHCPADDPRFAAPGAAWHWPSLSFPRAPIGFGFAGGPTFVADPSTAVMFNKGQEYTRTPAHARGSRTDWIEVRPDILAALLAEEDPRLADPAQEGRAYRFATAPVPSAVYLAQRQLHERLRSDEPRAILEIEEAALDVVRAVVRTNRGRAEGSPPTHVPASDPVPSAVEAVCAMLRSRLAEPPDLYTLADSVALSPSYLCTLFRRVTGSTIRGYLHTLRAHHALELLADTRWRHCEIALRLGYSSESHFSDRFFRAFGQRPSTFRRSLAGPG